MTVETGSEGKSDARESAALTEAAGLRERIESVSRESDKALRELSARVEAIYRAVDDQKRGASSSAKRQEEIATRLQELSKQLAGMAEGEVFQSTLERAVTGIKRGAEAQLEEEREESRRKLERSQQEILAEIVRATTRVDKALQELSAQSDELQMTMEERRKLIRDYKPGTIEEQNQRIAVLRGQIHELEKERLELRKEREERVLELKRLQSSQGHLSQEELEARRKSLDAREARIGNAEEVRVERDALRKQLDEIEPVRLAYERGQQAIRLDATLRTQNAALTKQVDQLLADKEELLAQLGRREQALESRDKRLAEHKRTQDEQVKRLLALEADKADKEKRIQELETSVEVERERCGKQLESLQEKRAELEAWHRRLKEAEQAAFANRLEERKQFDTWKQERQRELDLAERTTEETVRRRVAAENDAQVAELKRSLGDANAQLASVKQIKQRLESELEAAQQARVAFLSEKAQLEAEVEQARREMEALDQRARATEQHLAQLTPQLEGLRARKAALEEENKVALQGFEERRQREKAELDALIEQRKQLEERTVDKKKRLEPIQSHWEAPRRRPMVEQREEQRWLADVAERIERTGFKFPRRLLEAFHTSLKIASWAPLTALAGVSGTGKSELPRLYAHCGGIRFLSVPVQPNWDSPQDLFGFFNYMDGRFRATDLVRALYQSQQPPTEGFNDGMLLVLLDEMNRARFELYFSELLSRLESRRGAGTEDERCLQVDLGAGVNPLKLPLGQNVLFVGTMNEDESTYSLSDMVLDRGNVLSFPRPRRLKRREFLQTLTPRNEVLSHDTWSGWIREPAKLPDEAREAITRTLEQVNEALALVNRAIGHRVLQAVESYVVNYPGDLTSEQAWTTALEDQLAQKIMPKLRGIELDSQAGGECLDAISSVLQEQAPALRRDFEQSRERSQGAFIWSSSSYLDGKGDA
ncbi:AAA family ATPase [Archangium primigenium]|uniref:AAA family ATPase n=1 Tax=[Archangium] primigenium TaxID=2792470 RepID=UPI00195EC0CF|nr:AAA family ATPase [Archangium primigenium]MBM7115742.1 AAA family ATPase [Archangium primigenium]